MWRKIIWGLGIVIFILTILYFDLISYGIRQGWGQARLLWQVQSFERFLAKSDYPDSTKKFSGEKKLR
ncbi:MAG: hypothetical protein HC913_17240 [Microscillaceae bacterium]|nr:hypothetical protein [Microscillaceae bacterium]